MRRSFVILVAFAGAGAHAQVYSNMVQGNDFSVSSTSAVGFVAEDDYDTGLTAGGFFTLQSMRFIGGVNVAGGVLTMGFYDQNNIFQGNISHTWTTAGVGVQVWNGIFFPVPTVGKMRITADRLGSLGNPCIGTWVLNSLAPTVGTTTSFPGYTEPGTGAPMNFKFELTAVPEPASFIAVGLGLAALAIRRRK